MNVGPVELLLTVLLVVVPAALLLWWALRVPKESDIRFWASSYALPVTDANLPVLHRYLTRAQRWRRLGFVVGLVAIGPVNAALGVSVASTGYLLPGLGYSAGIVLAALAQASSARLDVTASASLERRQLRQYLPRKLVWIPRSVVLVGLAALLWSLDNGGDPSLPEHVTDAQLVTLFALDVAVLLVAEILEHAVVARRQPTTQPDLVAADDAIRTQTVHALAGAVIIAGSSLLAPLLWRAVYGEAARFDDALEAVAVFAPLLGWVVGIWYQNRAWRVRRAVAGPVTAAPA